MKQTVTNEFKDGLNLDLHPIVTPNTVLTDNLNGTFITYNGNEFCLQNDRGNKQVASLSYGFTPIGIKEHNGILYIISVRDYGYENWFTEIGTYPGVNWDIEKEKEYDLDYTKYTPLKNLYISRSPSNKSLRIQNWNGDKYDDVYSILINHGIDESVIQTALNASGYTFIHVYNVEECIQQLSDLNVFEHVFLIDVPTGGNNGIPVPSEFRVTDFGFTKNTPVTIEIQDSYDGSVNLIFIDGKHKNRLINTGFSVLPNNKYKLIERKTDNPTNSYNNYNFDEQSGLVKTSNVLTNIELNKVQSGGQLKGGNYTFYIKFGDADSNQTDVVAESGIVSIFNGNDGVPSTISGTLLDERTDKMVSLRVTGLNNAYSKIYIYYSREYSDTQGYRMTEYGMFKEPIDISENPQDIWLTGFEQITPINSEELNVDYHTIDWARAEAQHSNILFLGNVGQSETFQLYKKLEKLAATVSIKEYRGITLSSIDYDYFNNSEYYSTENIYKFVGYYPDEIYRFGIVFILNDGSKTPVFNVKGNISSNDDKADGIYRVSNANNVLSDSEIKPIGLTFTFPENSEFPSNVKGWFVVRQKRIPNTICEGLSIAIDKKSKLPVVWDGQYWITQSFISCNRELNKGLKKMYDECIEPNPDSSKLECKLVYDASSPVAKFEDKTLFEYKDPAIWKEASGLLTLDPCVKQEIASIFDGSEFEVEKIRNITTTKVGNLIQNKISSNVSVDSKILKCVFIPSNTGVKVIDDYEFSNVAGSAADTSQFKYFTFPAGIFEGGSADGNNWFENLCTSSSNWSDAIYGYVPVTRKGVFIKLYEDIKSSNESLNSCEWKNVDYLYKTNLNINLIRGLFTPYVGVATDNLDYGVYAIRHKKSSEINNNDYLIRRQDNSEYYCISDYIPKQTTSYNVYRGDCYTNTVTIRIIRNFIDADAPTSDVIVNENGWQKWVIEKDLNASVSADDRVQIEQVNRADVNTVDLGLWVTFKCLSSYNLGLRSKDTFHTDEMALLGSPRSFYPLNGASTATGNKMEESFLLNDGLSATVGRKRYNLMPDVPYTKSEFANRIMFSNVNVTDAYTNGYRTFQGLSYKDYDKQYGAITKLIPLGQNIFVVMEHGLGLVPVNPKALMQTTTGEAIHIYGYGVLPDEMTIISQDYGSKYEHSVIRTPIGIYGLDTDAHKVWRFSDKQGFETISDMKVETYLKDYLEGQERDIEMGISDIRTHYNTKKGDLMFTWYDNKQLCSICYNERQNVWVTRYDWCPIVSENVNDEFYSLNKKQKQTDPNNIDEDCYIWDHKFDVARNGIDSHVSSWYSNNNGFEFEFVVSDPIGVSKMFDNLQIISNNVSPDELEISIIGDDYMFKRDGLEFNSDDYQYQRKEYPIHKSSTTSNIHDCIEDENKYSYLVNAKYKWDWRLHQTAICKTQKLRDIYQFGRRMGNMQYKNGMWFAQIEPLRISIDLPQQMKEIRIRDKWAKIRIKYTGKDLAIITAIKTLINI